MNGHLIWERKRRRIATTRLLRFYSGLERALDLDLDQVLEERWETSTAIVDWKVEHGIIQEYKLIELRFVWYGELSNSNGEPKDRGNNGLPSSPSGDDTDRNTIGGERRAAVKGRGKIQLTQNCRRFILVA